MKKAIFPLPSLLIAAFVPALSLWLPGILG